jgi:hypothetical protein
MMNNKVYDILKWVAMLFLPALATFVSGLCLIWQIPYGEEIAKTIMLVDAFLGACLGVSSIQYKNKDNIAE